MSSPDPPSTMYVNTTDATTPQPRRSKLFFGVCDMRTATVALDVLNLGFTAVVVVVLTLVYLLQGGPFVGQNILAVLGSGVVTASLSGLGLYAAMHWRLKALYGATAGFLSVLVWRCIHLDWVDILVNALLLYPHAMLAMEMRSGVMTPETFENEEYLTEGGRDFVEMAHQYISPKNGADDSNNGSGGAMA